MIIQEYKHRIIYADTDAMGVMYYANYLRIYEGARADFLDKIGLSLSDMIDRNIVCPVVNVNIDYITPAKYNWTVKVVSTVQKTPSVRLIFEHKMYSPDEVLLNCATITLGFVNTESFRPMRCPEWIREGFEKHFK